MSGTRKTISMSKNTVSGLLHALAELIEKDEELASKLISKIQTSVKRPIDIEDFFDKNVSDNDIKLELENLTIEDLVLLVGKYSLDSNRVVRKWKNKERIIAFILERRKNLVYRYEGF
jgi:hypothetical protein